jgi:hypothetical protein
MAGDENGVGKEGKFDANARGRDKAGRPLGEEGAEKISGRSKD